MNITDSSSVPLLFDTFWKGGVIPGIGALNDVWGVDALKNALIMFIQSFRGEDIRAPESGGYVTQWLMRSMAENTISQIKMSIRDGLDQDFSVPLTINALEVTPNYSQRYWTIYLDVTSDVLNVRTSVSINIMNQV